MEAAQLQLPSPVSNSQKGRFHKELTGSTLTASNRLFVGKLAVLKSSFLSSHFEFREKILRRVFSLNLNFKFRDCFEFSASPNAE